MPRKKSYSKAFKTLGNYLFASSKFLYKGAKTAGAKGKLVVTKFKTKKMKSIYD